MNHKLTLRVIGTVLMIEAALMLFPLLVSLVCASGEYMAFVWSIPILAVTGTLLTRLKPKDKTFRAKEAFAATALSWVAMSVFGALPFYFSGFFDGFVDCVFEAVSGFTTTGASILASVEVLPRGIMFWRLFTHWIGGMGVLMFMLAVMPSMSATAVNLMRAESTGPSPDKIVPKIRETARIMYLIYLAMTVLLIVLLMITGLPVYDSVVNAFSVAGTGGFAIMNASIGAYNNLAAEIVMTVFMFLFGVSFTLYFLLLGRKFVKVIRDSELKFYFGIVIASIIVITLNISNMYGGVAEALRQSSFQVSSIISTTGFATTDFNLWPPLSQAVLVLLMVTGCCAGSTGGGVKLIRVVILLKAAKIQLEKIFHPGSVKAVTLNEKNMETQAVLRTALFFFIYFVVFTCSVLLISIEGTDIVTGSTAVISAISNIGPGLGVVGPTGNYGAFTSFSKVVLSFCMIAGRLEFFPVLVLFTPAVWRKGR